MARSRPSPRNDDLLAAERDVRRRLRERGLDFASMSAVSNIYRAAAAVRRKAERTVLAEHDLSWGGFTILWVLWIWDEMETAQLAGECDLAKGTLTGMLATLERADLVSRTRVTSDRRRVLVALTPRGRATIESVFPEFNAFETAMTAGLDDDHKAQLAHALRVVITNAQP
jgi:DNA-binding MarR family transcriptional regulator